MTKSRSLLLFASLLALVAVSACRAKSRVALPDASPVTTILLVRHAEKGAAPPDNPPLSAEGQERARSLAHVASEAGVKAIYTSQFARTRETVEPLANRLGLAINQIDASDTARLINEVKSRHAGEVVLIVGHSNTVPNIIDALGGDLVPSIDDKQYDYLFVVTLPRAGKAKVVRLKYGRPT